MRQDRPGRQADASVDSIQQHIVEPGEFEQQYSMGMANYKNRLYDRALKNFSMASNSPGRLVDCIVMGAQCHLKRGRLRKAINLLQQGLRLKKLTVAQRHPIQEQLRKIEKVAAALGDNPDQHQLKLSSLAEWHLTPVAEWEHLAISEWEQSVTAQWEQYLKPAAPVDAEPSSPAVPVDAPAPESKTAAAPESSPEPAEVGASTEATQDMFAAPTSRWISMPGYFLAISVLVAGWLLRGEQYLIPKEGVGYLFGIIGGLAMVSQLLYPLRKKNRLMRNWGATRHWFSAHVVFGILGPILVLFHANFSLGSINSAVVLGCTLLIALSGFFGRYLYTRIHYGLHGERLTLSKMSKEITSNHNNLAYVFVYAPMLRQRLLNFEKLVLTPPSGAIQGLLRVIVINIRKRWTRRVLLWGLRRALKITAKRNDWPKQELKRQLKADRILISRHLEAVLRVAEFSFFERFFALWHLFHMPMFVLLIVAGIVHVIAVHMF